jgi:hypothetical protein
LPGQVKEDMALLERVVKIRETMQVIDLLIDSIDLIF